MYVDVNFSGKWNIKTAGHDVSTAKSRTGFIILFAGCPIIWSSRLQTQISLSTTKAKCVVLSQSLREVILIMNLFTKFKSKEFNVVSTTLIIVCTAFEDHFRKHVIQKKIAIKSIDTLFQMANIFTKPLCSELLLRHRKVIQYF